MSKKNAPTHTVTINGFRLGVIPTPTGFKWVDCGEQCDTCGTDEFTRNGQELACDKCGSTYTISGPAIQADATTKDPKEVPMSKNTSADDLGLDTPARKAKTEKVVKAKADKPAKAKGDKPAARGLDGKKLAPTEAGLAAREGSLRASIVAAFKGGRIYETGMANLAAAVKASPRGTKGGDLKALLTARVRALVAKGLLKAV